MRGKLIVIEGTDCSGKQTQSEMLIKRLKEDGIKIKCLSFPMYDTPTGKILKGPYLGGESVCKSYFEEGAPNVDAKVSSLYYAADRKYNVSKITEKIESGINVVLDRYTTSNMAHQGGKIKDKQQRLNLYKWIENLEWDLLELPRPDIYIFLHMPYEYSLNLKKNRGELDANEKSKDHLIDAENAYIELSEIYKFKTIECVENNEIKTIESINNEIYQYIKQNYDL